MIENGFTYVSVLMLLGAPLVLMERKTSMKLFEYLPSIVLLYFIVMLLSTLGLWQKNDSITNTYVALKTNLLPAMIFLMLLGADLREIVKMGKKMLGTFFLASLSIGVGFIGMLALLQSYFPPEAWKPFAALCGSWMGGTGNMIAIQGALDVPDSAMGYTLLIDSIDYALWVMILLALVPFATRFNLWSKADTSIIDEVGARLMKQDAQKESVDFPSVFFLFSLALLVSTVSQYGASMLPTTSFLDAQTWVIIIATLSGILFAMTPLAKIGGADIVSNSMLYLIVALIASRANFAELTQAPLYIFAGVIVLAIHAALMILFAKLFKLDLFSIGVASLANIGGVASAPILASAYSKALIPIGVLMAMMGYIIGTFGGLMVGKVLEMIGGV
jgi:uncharacterized membrane protein